MRLDLADGVRLFDSPDLLAVGWLANREREKRHAGRTFYNFNIRLEATNVCVASCLFCSFARLKPGDPGRVHDVARAGLGQAALPRASAAHRNPRRQRPAPGPAVRLLHGDAARLQADPPGDPPEVLHRRRDRVLRGSLRHDRRAGAARAHGRRPRFAARRRRRDLRRARPPQDRARQVRHRALPRDPPHRAPPRHAHERDDAVRAHRDVGRARGSHAARTRAAGRDRRLPGVHPAGVSPRQQSDAQAARRRAPPTACACTPSRASCATTSRT